MLKALVLFLITCGEAAAFWTPTTALISRSTRLAAAPRLSEGEIIEQLTKYLQVRKESNADEEAERLKGKVVGGTKGNKILEYISAAPVKEQVIEQAPNVFDYDELSRYGFGNLVTPIMDLGGRKAAYELMGMEMPETMMFTKKKEPAAPVVIDRTGETDEGRYKGLGLGRTDDNAMAAALEAARERAQRGERLRPKIAEEDYVQPFADKRNIGPKQTPVWTAEKLDEYGIQQGKAEDWARRAKMGEFVKDAGESALELDLVVRVYWVLTAALISVAFGRSTPAFLTRFLEYSSSDTDALLSALQIPATALALAGVGSAVVCAVVLAPPKNRNAAVWAFKGLVGGPLSLSQLRGLEKLTTQEEQEKSRTT